MQPYLHKELEEANFLYNQIVGTHNMLNILDFEYQMI